MTLRDEERQHATCLLLDVSSSSTPQPASTEKLFSLVYDELRAIAGKLMRRERPEHTLQPTALVHEAYLRLVDETRIQWQDRAHFFGIAARAMRQILVEHARSRSAAKRGGGWKRITLDTDLPGGRDPHLEVLDLDQALGRLSALDERVARVVELRVFAGMTMQEIAHILVVSKRTVDNDWAFASAWLGREMQGEKPS
jgi:RNA polymerase sigma factor (TIGR02999 family)